ncbi:kinase-like protein [Neoconidiobolus thromboides FSU 785]|nr:kinase-like protein [Neoconidiobolus thromboides FSU 785]
MTVLLDICQCIEVGRELISEGEETKILTGQMSKITRKVKRGELIIEDIKKNFDAEEEPNTKRLGIVVKNYLSILASCLEFVQALNKKYAITNMLNSENHKKALYSILNDIEQAIFELDTEACLIERLNFEKAKKSMQAMVEEDKVLDSVVVQNEIKVDNKVTTDMNHEDKKTEISAESKNKKENEALPSKLTLNQPENDIPSSSDLNANNAESSISILNDSKSENVVVGQEQSNMIGTKSENRVNSTDINTQQEVCQKLDDVSSKDTKTQQEVSLNVNSVISNIKKDEVHQLTQGIEEMKIEKPYSILSEEFKAFLKTHYIPGGNLVQEDSLNKDKSVNEFEHYKIKKYKIYFPGCVELVEEKSYVNKYQDNLKMILKEIANLHNLQGSPYVVRLFGITDSSFGMPDFYPYSVLVETTSSGCLYDYIKCGKNKGVEFNLTLMEDIAHGLVYLHHTRNFSHNNLNAYNILITESNRGKITGFEFSVKLNSTNNDVNNYSIFNLYKNDANNIPLSKLIWLDPYYVNSSNQIISNYYYDIYSYGLLFFSLFSLTLPYDKLTKEEVYNNMKNNITPNKNLINQQYHLLLDRTWDPKPENRPNAHQLLSLLNEPVHLILPDQQYHLQPQFQLPPSPSNFFSPQFQNADISSMPQLPPTNPNLNYYSMPIMPFPNVSNYSPNLNPSPYTIPQTTLSPTNLSPPFSTFPNHNMVNSSNKSNATGQNFNYSNTPLHSTSSFNSVKYTNSPMMPPPLPPKRNDENNNFGVKLPPSLPPRRR